MIREKGRNEAIRASFFFFYGVNEAEQIDKVIDQREGKMPGC